MGGKGSGGWGHLEGAVHMEAARHSCKRAMVGTKWANPHWGCMNGLRNAILTFWGVHFWLVGI